MIGTTQTSGVKLDQFAEAVLTRLLADTGWTLTAFTNKPALSSHVRCDHLAQLQSGHTQVRLYIETESNPRSGAIARKAELLRPVLQQRNGVTALAVFVQRVTPLLAKTLRELGLGYFDLYGTCYLRWPGLYIERRGRQKPLLSERRRPGLTELLRDNGLSAGNIFGTRSWMRQRAVRGMLSYPDRKWHQTELAQEVGLDPAAVNRVIQFLLEEHHADYEGKGPGKVVFLTHPGATLEMWAGYWTQSWSKLRKAQRGFYSLAMNTDELKRDLTQAAAQSGRRVGFTLSAGSDYFGSYMRDDQVCGYFGGDLQDLARAAQFDVVERGANVVLLPLRDEGLLYMPQHLDIDEEPYAGPVCPVQLYLDMRAAGGRYAEQAEALRKEVLRY